MKGHNRHYRMMPLSGKWVLSLFFTKIDYQTKTLCKRIGIASLCKVFSFSSYPMERHHLFLSLLHYYKTPLCHYLTNASDLAYKDFILKLRYTVTFSINRFFQKQTYYKSCKLNTLQISTHKIFFSTQNLQLLDWLVIKLLSHQNDYEASNIIS